MVPITIVNGVYKPSYNWGAPPCIYSINWCRISQPPTVCYWGFPAMSCQMSGKVMTILNGCRAVAIKHPEKWHTQGKTMEKNNFWLLEKLKVHPHSPHWKQIETLEKKLKNLYFKPFCSWNDSIPIRNVIKQWIHHDLGSYESWFSNCDPFHATSSGKTWMVVTW